MIKNPVMTVWLRLISVLLIFSMLMVALGSQPIRGNRVDSEELLLRSMQFVVQGPAIPLYWHFEPFAILVTIGFWIALFITAKGSISTRKRRWFYVLLSIYIVLTSIGLLGEIAMGLIAMSHAL
jgi:hypothetical protein